MTDILASIDAAIDGTCPCGADPRPGSAYCGDDCVPNYRGEHTSSDTDGTAMRWRPDLVTEVDDSDLISLGSNTFYTGRFHARLFQRGNDADGVTTWHLRLDDGYRFVGADLHDVRDIGDELERRVAEKWAALDRELGSSRHVDTARAPRLVPSVQVFTAPLGAAPNDPSSWTELGTLTADGLSYASEMSSAAHFARFDNSGVTFTPSPVTTWSAATSDPLADMQAVRRHLEEAVNRAVESLASMGPAFERFNRSVGEAFPAAPSQPQHPMLAAIERRRNRNTGPEQRQRAPRQISPRG